MALLEKASFAAPQNASILSNLSAAYLASAAADKENAAHWSAALTSAERALRQDHSFLPALFNRAVAREGLGLDGYSAQLAWRFYLLHDGSSEWAEEAEAHLAHLERPADPELWRVAVPRLRLAALAGDTAEIVRITSRFPQQVRTYGETDLLAVAAAEAAERTAATPRDNLGVARNLGEALATVSGDRMLLDAVEVLEQALTAGSRARLALLAAGHRAYAEGLRLYEEFKTAEATLVLERARTQLREAGSPLAAAATVELATCRYQGFRNDAATALLDEVERSFAAGAYPNLIARARWLQGLILLVRSRYAEALGAFRRSHELFLRTREAEHIAALDHLISEYSYFAGDYDQSWRDLLPALRSMHQISSPRRQYRICTAGTVMALAADQPEAALAFGNEALRCALRSGNAGIAASALRWQAMAHEQLGDRSTARQQIAAARQQALAIEDADLRSTVLGDILLVEGEILLPTEPQPAIACFSEALAIFRHTDFHLPVLRALTGRARAHRAIRAFGEAEVDFRDAIEEIERQRNRWQQESRIAFLDGHQALFEEMATLQIEVYGRPDLAYGYAERGQARVLSELLQPGADHAHEELTLERVQSALPTDTVLLQFLAGRQSGYVWSISRRGSTVHRIRLSREELSERVHAFRRSLNEDAHAARVLASELYNHLLAAPMQQLPRGTTLVVVPHGPLHELPFAALYSNSAGRFVVQSHPLVVAPSSRVYLRALQRARTLAHSSPPRVLAVGNPAFDRRLFTLDPLPGAEEEARELTRFYSGSTLLLGEQATPEQFLALAPQHDVLHIGSHARLNLQAPQRSHLVLAPSAAVPTGALYAEQLYAQRLPRTSLAVLAACSAAGGRLSESEGIMSFARPFLAAGVPSVVAPLWRVGDREAQQFSRELHRRIAAGQAPALAMREAQLTLLHSEDRKLASPRVWAAFVLIGNG